MKVLAGALLVSVLLSCANKTSKQWPLVVVLGVDGMDPVFLSRHLTDLPNLRALAQQGEFKPLQTTMPPQSPVAWSTFSTGLDPVQDGILDFVYRDPRTMMPFSAMGETEAPAHELMFGPYQLPMGTPKVKTFRRGEVFWKVLAGAGVPVKILRMPVNYPPEPGEGDSLSGMGVPDMRGTFGTFTFYTDNPAEQPHDVAGGQFVPVSMNGDRALLTVEGPANPYRRDGARSSVMLTVDVDPFEEVARFRVQDQTFILRSGEWSEWIPVSFPVLDGFKSAHGMFRVYAKGFRPNLEIYVSPVNFDPSHPDAEISRPSSYSADISRKIGLFYTQGMPEDTSAYRHNVFDRDEYLTQAASVAGEQIRMLQSQLAGFRHGFLFIHLSGVDQNSHMLWGKFDDDLLHTYQTFDTAVGWVMKHEPEATIIVMSDHGFASFTRTVNLNAWLLQRGLLREESSQIDWPKTSVYALGLNAVYLNLAGRERNGIVSKSQAPEVLRHVSEQLLGLRDPRNGSRVVARVWSPHPDFRGDIQYIPDLIVGFAPPYRSAWEGSLGSPAGPVVADNNDPWVGDHCMAPEYVPGVLLSNRKSQTDSPRLKDLTASILSLYHVAHPAGMKGKSIY